MHPPEGLGASKSLGYRLCKSRQSLQTRSLEWEWVHCAQFGKFHTTLTNFGFKQSYWDHSLFLLHTGIIVILVYVNDILIFENDLIGIQQLQQTLKVKFLCERSWPYDLTYFFRFEVTHSKHGILLTQTKYTKELIHLAHHTDLKLVDSPIK